MERPGPRPSTGPQETPRMTQQLSCPKYNTTLTSPRHILELASAQNQGPWETEAD